MTKGDTIVALATPPGHAGVGIIRISGPLALGIAQKFLKINPLPRQAHYTSFYFPLSTKILDQGIIIYFPHPHSFTGEDVVEFQGHGGPVILDILLNRIIFEGARLARPGEFSERAFLNDKIDLIQAEATADLINATSEQAVRCAIRSLQGEFSQAINQLVEKVTHLRIYVEAAIDFPEEEADFLAEGNVVDKLKILSNELKSIMDRASQGSILREGINVVIAGSPNVGKSSLLNTLSERETAIVTDIEGTTRDVLKEQIHIDGMPLHIIDTAGLRESVDLVEMIGIERAWKTITEADYILLLVDARTTQSNDPFKIWPEFCEKLSSTKNLTIIRNKIDLINEKPGIKKEDSFPVVSISAKNKSGIKELKTHLKEIAGYNSSLEGGFTARRRHLDALNRAEKSLKMGLYQIMETQSGELLAEDLRLLQRYLGEITGEVTPDDLLGEIFSSFCIGK